MPQFNPPDRTLMGPGPSDVSPRVLKAMARQTIGHLDPKFIELMDDIKRLLQYAFQTENGLTMPISGPGTAGMEACVVNLVSPGDTVIVCQNGVFGRRIEEMVKRAGGLPIPIQDEWGQPVDPEKLKGALERHPEANTVAFVHAETSTGAQSDAKTLAGLAQAHGCLTIVDTVTSLGGTPLKVDEWGLDAVYSGSQKCLSCAPGLSPVTFSDRALERIKGRETPVLSWFLDVSLVMNYWGSGARRAYHHTAPINALYGLHESLVILEEEGLENAWARHQNHHQALAAGLETLGLRYIVEPSARLPQLNAVSLPNTADDMAIRRALLEKHDLEIGGGLGDLAGAVWRIGLMGHACSAENVLKCLGALEAELGASGGVAAAQRVYGESK